MGTVVTGMEFSFCPRAVHCQLSSTNFNSYLFTPSNSFSLHTVQSACEVYVTCECVCVSE